MYRPDGVFPEEARQDQAAEPQPAQFRLSRPPARRASASSASRSASSRSRRRSAAAPRSTAAGDPLLLALLLQARARDQSRGEKRAPSWARRHAARTAAAVDVPSSRNGSAAPPANVARFIQDRPDAPCSSRRLRTPGSRPRRRPRRRRPRTGARRVVAIWGCPVRDRHVPRARSPTRCPSVAATKPPGVPSRPPSLGARRGDASTEARANAVARVLVLPGQGRPARGRTGRLTRIRPRRRRRNPPRARAGFGLARRTPRRAHRGCAAGARCRTSRRPTCLALPRLSRLSRARRSEKNSQTRERRTGNVGPRTIGRSQSHSKPRWKTCQRVLNEMAEAGRRSSVRWPSKPARVRREAMPAPGGGGLGDGGRSPRSPNIPTSPHRRDGGRSSQTPGPSS